MSEKYLKYQITTRKAGLRHQAYNLKTLIYEAHSLQRLPVISKWHLFGYHNFKRGIDTDFLAYFDFDRVCIEDKPIQIVMEHQLTENQDEQIYHIGKSINTETRFAVRYFPSNEGCSWKFIDTDFDIYHKVKIPYAKKVISLAEKLLKEIGSPLTVVHVRRRDVLKKKWRLWIDTRPKNILNVLNKVDSTENVYIMSNEPRSGFFDKIKDHYTLFTINDFPWLLEIQAEDNFLAFCIENQLLKMSEKKVTTFSDNTDEGWDGYLSKATW